MEATGRSRNGCLLWGAIIPSRFGLCGGEHLLLLEQLHAKGRPEGWAWMGGGDPESSLLDCRAAAV